MSHLFSSRRLFQTVLFVGVLGGGSVAANAQVTAIDPFVGNYSEDWETFANYAENEYLPLVSPSLVCDGEAEITNPGMTIYQTGLMDASLGLSGFAQTSGGNKGMQISSLDPTALMTFEYPMIQFGAYWGAETFGGPTTIQVDFFTTANTLFASQLFDYDHEATGDGGLDWHGWQSTVPFASLEITGNQVTMDGLQALTVPEPNAAVCLLAGILGGFWLRQRHRRSLCKTSKISANLP